MSDLICREVKQTGSFIKRKTVCLSPINWQRVYEQQRTLAQKMVDDNRGLVLGF